MDAAELKRLALATGFELAGIAPALRLPEFEFYGNWVRAGLAGEMRYLTDRRGDLRRDPRLLLPSAKSILCVGKLYNGPEPYSTGFTDEERAWISRYAWGDDYHDVVRRGLECVISALKNALKTPFECRICVDTAPLLERAYAHRAGLGWIGKNTCLIHEGAGSWFFLGEVLLSVELEPDCPPPDRCGTCTRCTDACPTGAIGPARTLDSRLCISYYTIELRGEIPEPARAGLGRHVFGCDICQDVCPWNRKAPLTADPAFRPRDFAPPLERLAALSEEEFRALFRGTAITRARYSGFLRNVAIAMGNSGRPEFRPLLERLARHDDPVVREHSKWGLARLSG